MSAGGEDKGLVLVGVVVETQQAGEGHCSDHDVLVTILSLPVLSTSSSSVNKALKWHILVLFKEF